jgi:murein DD-endopeptidase MepM/ murein hydrolase activator NlpD
MLPRWLVDRGYFGRGFGPRTTSTGAVRPHSAVDITASRGQPIRAILPGIVEWAGWVNGYGNCTLIRHADGMTSFYAHATRLLVAVGNTVAQGQQVAEVGNTGFERMGTHLHTAVHRGLPQGVRMTTDVEARYGVDPRPVWASLGTAMVREIGE